MTRTLHNRNITVELAQSTGDDHLTEDAAWSGVYEHHAVLAIADGAPLRLRPINSLQPLLDKYKHPYGAGITPSGVASRLLRDTVAGDAIDPDKPLAEMVLAANARLAHELTLIYGALSAEAVLGQEPHLTILAEDQRYIRLMLPASTYTVARVNWQRHTLEVAHGADSALIAIYTDGRVQQLTPDQMAQHDDAAKQLYIEQRDTPARHPFFRALGDNRGRELNRTNGLYHNYIGLDYETDSRVGVSVLNGLPTIADYMFTASYDLHDIQAILLVTDGMFWPKPLTQWLHPRDAEADARQLQRMGLHIRDAGVAAYIHALRAEERRLRESSENPYQWHDDATGLLCRLQAGAS